MTPSFRRILLVFAALLLTPSLAHAQWSSNGNGVYYNSGKVGVGTSDNSASTLNVSDEHYGNFLQLGGFDRSYAKPVQIYSAYPYMMDTRLRADDSGWGIAWSHVKTKDGVVDDPSQTYTMMNVRPDGQFGSGYRLDVNGDLRLGTITKDYTEISYSSGGFPQMDTKVHLSSSGDSFLNGGNVGIGTTSPNEKLAVNGKVRAREVIVETSNWPDYVFDDDYALRSIDALKQFIGAHRHLPGMPSEDVVTQDGQTLGAIQQVLVEKVEELTLYTIEQQDDIDALREQVKLLKEQNDLLRRQNDALRDSRNE